MTNETRACIIVQVASRDDEAYDSSHRKVGGGKTSKKFLTKNVRRDILISVADEEQKVLKRKNCSLKTKQCIRIMQICMNKPDVDARASNID